jgi:hypothetical protein
MTTPGPDDKADRSPVVVICSTVLALAVLGLYAWQSAHGQDTGTTFTLVVITLAAAVPGVASYTRAGALQRDVTAVRHQTNGNTSELLAMLREAQRQLAASTPAAPPDVRDDAPDEPTQHAP